jgi:hypothetical protein
LVSEIEGEAVHCVNVLYTTAYREEQVVVFGEVVRPTEIDA